MHDSEIRLAILISGGGSTMETIVRSSQEGELQGKVRPVAVISSRTKNPGFRRAQELGIPAYAVRKMDFPDDPDGLQFGDAINAILYRYRPDVLSQNGWLPTTPANVISLYRERIFNQHPAPLDPDHRDAHGIPFHMGGQGIHGLAAHAATLKFRELILRPFPKTEATIHRVSTDVDGGTVVFREEVPIIDGDTPECLSQRVLPAEHQAQISFWQIMYDGSVRDLHRPERLVQPGEEEFLRDALIFAREKYPNG